MNWRAVKKYLVLVALVFIAYKILGLLNMDEVILDFFVLGIIPGTNFSLNLYMVAILGLICLVYIWRWAKKVNEQLIAFKLESTRKEAVKAKMTAKTLEQDQKHTPEVEIEELKIAST
ncbi:hypothetical protein DYH10_03275 [Candidatus Saccharibacteria bacterium CPR2]|nr:hypothetical protein [Candidatus Saccharibacteria bacterium CPR2]